MKIQKYLLVLIAFFAVASCHKKHNPTFAENATAILMKHTWYYDSVYYNFASIDTAGCWRAVTHTFSADSLSIRHDELSPCGTSRPDTFRYYVHDGLDLLEMHDNTLSRNTYIAYQILRINDNVLELAQVGSSLRYVLRSR